MATDPLRLLEASAFAVVVTKASLLGFARSRGPWLTRELLSCAMCFGWWSGLGFYVLAPRFPELAAAVGFASLTAMLALVLRLAVYWLEQHASRTPPAP